MADSTVNINGIQQLVFQSGSLSFLNCVNDTVTLGISGGSGTSVALQTNSVNNTVQSILNLIQGTGVSLTAGSTGGVTIASTVVAPTFQTNSSNNATQSLLNIVAGPGVSLTNTGGQVQIQATGGSGTNAGQIQGTSVSSNAPNPGDVLVYSPNANTSVWNVFGVPQRNMLWYPTENSTTMVGEGCSTAPGLGVGGGTATFVSGTSTEGICIRLNTSSAANTNTTGYSWIASGAVNTHTIASWRRFDSRVRVLQTSNIRVWVGLAWNNVGIPGTTSFAADSPTASFFVGFRYSATTDANWTAVTINSTGNITATTTGVAVNTSSSQILSAAIVGSVVNFYIDGTFAVSINTNVPSGAQGVGPLTTIDNKNTANLVQIETHWFNGLMK